MDDGTKAKLEQAVEKVAKAISSDQVEETYWLAGQAIDCLVQARTRVQGQLDKTALQQVIERTPTV